MWAPGGAGSAGPAPVPAPPLLLPRLAVLLVPFQPAGLPGWPKGRPLLLGSPRVLGGLCRPARELEDTVPRAGSAPPPPARCLRGPGPLLEPSTWSDPRVGVKSPAGLLTERWPLGPRLGTQVSSVPALPVCPLGLAGRGSGLQGAAGLARGGGCGSAPWPRAWGGVLSEGSCAGCPGRMLAVNPPPPCPPQTWMSASCTTAAAITGV